MRRPLILTMSLALFTLAGCFSDPVRLKNTQSGQEAQCLQHVWRGQSSSVG